MARFAMEFDTETLRFSRRVLPEPTLEVGEVLVDVICCTICGSDLHTFCGRRQSPHSCILGHEIVGSIAAWGGDAVPRDFHGNRIHVGQRVTWTMAVGCGRCFYCQNQLWQKCQSLFKYGHQSLGKHPSGGYSSCCVLIPGTPIFPVPEVLSDEVAATANCAVATVCAALRLVEQTQICRDSTAVILGAGMLGLTAAAQLSEFGAKNIVMVDPNFKRLETANSFGATHTVCSSNDEEIRTALTDLTKGRGADIAFDFAGMTTAVETCLNAVRIGGTVLLAGSVFPGGTIQVSPEQVVRRMLTIRGLHNYLPSDLNVALQFLSRVNQRFPFAGLVSRTFSLDEVEQAFHFAAEHQPVRVAVQPGNMTL